ncbi:response regulator [Brevundimonas sp. NIBR11]|uniref:response regulator n=1 Tax=Brevundimonas sp. NIBR11 TaxID=3015999 RepID=UPI0022F0A8E8|nr:response regulator [Brevundimonas sp. NIBR11]WGM32750.1 hypothetical protein KKHFBJBL_03004 [Brevundimonas sp. NIBR11]
MFDGSINHPAADAETIHRDQENLDAILSRYDSLVATPEAMTAEQATDLAALAGIFDLDTTQAPADLWPEVRAVLTVQAPRVLDSPAFAEASESLTLLVVEDDPEMALDLTGLLVEAGHDVVGPFHSAEAAEVAAGLHVIDIALLDINLSGAVDGGTLARSLKSRWGLKVVFLSGDVTAAASHAEVAEAMVIKPYRGADVLAALQRLSAKPTAAS